MIGKEKRKTLGPRVLERTVFLQNRRRSGDRYGRGRVSLMGKVRELSLQKRRRRIRN